MGAERPCGHRYYEAKSPEIDGKLLMFKACLLKGEYQRARCRCGIEGAGSCEQPYEKVVWTISLRRLKRAPEHFVLFEGIYLALCQSEPDDFRTSKTREK